MSGLVKSLIAAGIVAGIGLVSCPANPNYNPSFYQKNDLRRESDLSENPVNQLFDIVNGARAKGVKCEEFRAKACRFEFDVTYPDGTKGSYNIIAVEYKIWRQLFIAYEHTSLFNPLVFGYSSSKREEISEPWYLSNAFEKSSWKKFSDDPVTQSLEGFHANQFSGITTIKRIRYNGFIQELSHVIEQLLQRE